MLVGGNWASKEHMQGYGYEVTFSDVLDSCKHFWVAAHRCHSGEPAAREANALTELYRSKLHNLLADALLRRSRDVALIDRSPSRPSTLLTNSLNSKTPPAAARAVNQLFGALPRPGEVSERRVRRGRNTANSAPPPASAARSTPRNSLRRNGVI